MNQNQQATALPISTLIFSEAAYKKLSDRFSKCGATYNPDVLFTDLGLIRARVIQGWTSSLSQSEFLRIPAILLANVTTLWLLNELLTEYITIPKRYKDNWLVDEDYMITIPIDQCTKGIL